MNNKYDKICLRLTRGGPTSEIDTVQLTIFKKYEMTMYLNQFVDLALKNKMKKIYNLKLEQNKQYQLHLNVITGEFLLKIYRIESKQKIDIKSMKIKKGVHNVYMDTHWINNACPGLKINNQSCLIKVKL